MFGNTAPTYMRWEKLGEPYKKNSRYYIKVLHPLLKVPKEVRFYTDAAHGKTAQTHKEPFYKVFFFESNRQDDFILIIKEKYLTADERDEYFRFKWRRCQLFGGIWYAAKTEIDKINNFPEHIARKIEKINWENFHKEGLRLYPDSEAWREG